MAGERIKLEVNERDGRGSAESRRLRARASSPAFSTGAARSRIAFFVPERELRRAL